MKKFVGFLLLAIFATSLSACGAMDPFKNGSTNFEMFDDGEFRFETVDFGPDIDGGHSGRMEWLDSIMTNNNFCPGGYKIDKERRALIVGERYNVIYYGHCV